MTMCVICGISNRVAGRRMKGGEDILDVGFWVLMVGLSDAQKLWKKNDGDFDVHPST